VGGAVRTAVLTALLLGVLAVPAGAVWGGTERASVGPMDATTPDVAMNARGDAAAVWVRGTGRSRQIVASHRPLAGGWTRPEGISRRGRPSIDPKVAVAPDGRIVTVWRQVARNRAVRVGGRRRAQAVYVARARELPPLAERWEPIATLSSPRQKVGRAFLGLDARGVAVAAWHWGTGTRPGEPGYVGEVQLAQRAPGAPWSAPQRASTAEDCVRVRRPRVAVGASGHAVVWWQCDLRGGRSVAAGVARGPDEAFGAEARMPITGGREIAADMAVAPDGRAVAVSGVGGTLRWWRGPVSQAGASLAELPALGTSEQLERGVGSPRIAAGSSSDALSAWIAPGGVTRTAPIAGDLGVAAPLTLGRDERAARVRVAAGGDRLGAVAWLSSGRVLAVSRGADGNTSARSALSGRGVSPRQPPALAMDDGGTAVAMWSRRRGGRSVVERAVYAAP
jgi:hypothetical protein